MERKLWRWIVTETGLWLVGPLDFTGHGEVLDFTVNERAVCVIISLSLVHGCSDRIGYRYRLTRDDDISPIYDLNSAIRLLDPSGQPWTISRFNLPTPPTPVHVLLHPNIDFDGIVPLLVRVPPTPDEDGMDVTVTGDPEIIASLPSGAPLPLTGSATGKEDRMIYESTTSPPTQDDEDWMDVDTTCQGDHSGSIVGKDHGQLPPTSQHVLLCKFRVSLTGQVHIEVE